MGVKSLCSCSHSTTCNYDSGLICWIFARAAGSSRLSKVWEIETDIREVKQVQKGEGKFLGGFTRFGFTVKEDKLIPNPEQQAIIKEMKGMRRRGMSLRRISKWLDRTHGVSMSHSTVSTFF
jgi:hypothetical protein